MELSNFEIKNLADCKEHFSIVCKWLWQEWGRDEDKSLEDIEYRTKYCLGKNDIPMTFVALIDNKPVGTFSLWRTDLDSRQDLSPWFATLYVVPKMRCNGIGGKLQEFAFQKARELNYTSFYLMTTFEGYYEKKGWKFLELAPLQKGKKARVYKYDL